MPEVKKLMKHFPGSKTSFRPPFDRAHGKVELMLGMALRSLPCTDRLAAQEIRVNNRIFHPGWVLTGYMPRLCKASPWFPAEVHSNAVKGAEPVEAQTFHIDIRVGPALRSHEVKKLGTCPATRRNDKKEEEEEKIQKQDTSSRIHEPKGETRCTSTSAVGDECWTCSSEFATDLGGSIVVNKQPMLTLLMK